MNLKYSLMFLYITFINEVINNIIKMSKIRFTNIKNDNMSLDALYK